MRHERRLEVLGERRDRRMSRPPGEQATGGPPGITGLRVLALHVPGLSLQRLARGRALEGLDGAAGEARPVAVVEAGRVVACDAAAREAGVQPGAALAQAMAACGRLLAVPHAPAADLAALRGLAEALLALAPAVEVAAPETLLLDAGAAHLVGPPPGGGGGGEPELILAQRAQVIAAGLGYAVRAAVATGRGPARALAQHGAAPLLRVPPGEEARALAPLPLAALGLGPAVAERLAAVGVEDVGGLARLPAEGLALRFGPAGAAAARLARGEDPTRLTPYVPATVPEEAMELEGPAETAEPLLFVLTRLAERVALRLAGRRLGASRLKLTLKLEPRGEERLLLPLTTPSATPARWLPLLRERLLALRLPGAVTALRLTAAEVAPLVESQLAFGDRPETAAALETVLARLAGRLGEGAVLAAEPVERYRPEAAWRTVPFTLGGPRSPPSPPARSDATSSGCACARQSRRGGSEGPPGPPARSDAASSGCACARQFTLGGAGSPSGEISRPTRLLAAPRLVVATGEGGRVTTLRIGATAHAVRSFEGPERISGEWWSAPFERDYYRVAVEGLGDCWIFRDGADGRLWLHGFFD